LKKIYPSHYFTKGWLDKQMDKTINQLKSPESILQKAIAMHSPSHIFILVSGGGDSTLTAQKTLEYLESVRYSGPRQVVSLNTLLFADDWPSFLRSHVKEAGWEYDPKKLFYTNPDPDFYEGWVIKYGFPYSPRGHLTMQNRLKLRAIEQLVREHKTQVGTRHEHYDRIMLVTGFRQLESQKRMQAKNPIQRKGAQLWVNPLFYYTDEQKNLELLKLGLPMNPYKSELGVSGDCGCGAYARPGEMDIIKKSFPCLGKRLSVLNDKAYKTHGYGYDEKPPKALAKIQAGQIPFTGDLSPLCAGCKWIKKGYGEAAEKRMLQNGI
jgi:3'-phosphoadenosine 5'-phosphosulfate sulfotransferase (PAPS reductase)/FAD synthetase